MIPINFLLKNYQKIAFGLVTLLAILFYFRMVANGKRADQAEKGRDVAVKVSNGWQEFHKVYVNKMGDTIKQIKALEVDQANLKALLKMRELEWVKKFEGLKRSGKDIGGLGTVSTSFHGDKIPLVPITKPEPCDTLYFSYSYHDEWNDIEAVVYDTPRFEMRDRYSAVVHKKKPKNWFWKFQWFKTELMVDIVNSNKLITVDSAAVIAVK